MPLVFVHGVATRQTPSYQKEVIQRDDLFRRLVVGDDLILDPDWGQGGVSFGQNMPWMPDPKAGEVFATGGGAGAAGVVGDFAIAAPADLEDAIDIAFVTALDDQTVAGPASPSLATAFEAAVTYLEKGADQMAFEALGDNQGFLNALEFELTPHAPAPPLGQAMGFGDAFSAIGAALGRATDPVRDIASDALLRLVRRPLSQAVAMFLGDIFVYLRWRETDAAQDTYSRIFKPIIKDLSAANFARTDTKPLILVCHSLGAVILYDLLHDARALADIEAQSGKPLTVDHWVTVGAQPALFADMGLYTTQRNTDGLLPKPVCVKRWMNVYDYTDVLAFKNKLVFADVEDFRYNNVAGVIEAHTTYFKRPSFFKRLRARMSRP